MTLIMRFSMKKLAFRSALLTLLLCAMHTRSFAGALDTEVDYRSQIAYELNWKLAKGLKFSLEPEIRFDRSFAIDSYQFGAGLRYKTLKYLYLGAGYRMIIIPTSSYESTTNNKFEFSATLKERFGRFTPSARVLYSNYADDEIDDKKFWRYRAKVEYDIRKCPLTPFFSMEAYQSMEENLLYKMRYSTGVDFKVASGKYLYFNYKMDYFQLKYKTRNIFGIGYKVNL